MRLMCGHLRQCGVWSECLRTKFGSIKIRPVFSFTPSSLPSNEMSAPAKSTTPIAPAIVESMDWMKATTPELLSGSKDKSSVLDTNAKECHHCKQVRREERQCWEVEEKRAHEEVERKARKEAEHKVREQAEKERAESQAQAESEQRKAVEEAAKQRAVEVAAKQKTMVQEASKKRARKESEASLVGEVQYVIFCFISAFVLLILFL